MADQKFQPGDVVVIKSGSPKMTVWFTSNDGWAYCYYFKSQSESISQEVKIPSSVLMLAE